MILVQISDTHIDAPGVLVYGKFDTSAALANAVKVINAMDPAPDLVLHTGDIASHGSVERYEAFAAVLKDLAAPVALMPGNHDDRGALRTVFGDTVFGGAEFGGRAQWPATGEFLHYVIEDYPVRIICCDSVIVGDSAGELCSDRIAWLEQRLCEAPQRPTIVALHHPPFYTGMTGSSATGLLRGGAELDALLRRHKQVVRVLAGHNHRPTTAEFGGTIAYAAPSTAYPFALETGPEKILAATFEAPAIAVHLWIPDASPSGPGLVTHTLAIGDWDAPVLLREGGVRVFKG